MPESKTLTIYDALTGETIERELTPEELEERELAEVTLQAELQAKVDAKASALAKLAALGLTEEEIAAL